MTNSKIFMIIILFLGGFFITLGAKGAEQNRQVYHKQFDYWAVACYVHPNNRFSHCTLSTEYKSGEEIYLMATKWDMQELKILNRKWSGNIVSERLYSMKLKFEKSGHVYNWKAFGKIEYDGTPGFVALGDIDFSFWVNWSEDRTVTIWVGDEKIGAFNLPGTRQAIELLMKKVDKYKQMYPPEPKPKDEQKVFNFDGSGSTKQFNF